jgi:hypothetical protein
VQRYIRYIDYYKIPACQVEFYDVSQWTSGDCSDDFPKAYKIRKVFRPSFLGKQSFGNKRHYIVCMVMIYRNLIRKLFNRGDSQSVIFIDQYFSPFEILALAESLSRKNHIVIHQHAINCKNQLERSFKKNILDVITHELIAVLFNLGFFELRYIAFATTSYGYDLFSKSFSQINIHLVGDINFSKLTKSSIKRRRGISQKTIGLISPGMFRYSEPKLFQAQSEFFQSCQAAIKNQFPDFKVVYRPKPGEKSEDFQQVKICEDSVDFYEFIGSVDVVVTSPISTTWVESIFLRKGVVVVRNRLLEKEYPKLFELFMLLSRELPNEFSELVAGEVYYVTKDNTGSVIPYLNKHIPDFQDPFYLAGKPQWQKL